jgi:hypothetical protein
MLGKKKACMESTSPLMSSFVTESALITIHHLRMSVFLKMDRTDFSTFRSPTYLFHFTSKTFIMSPRI